jgi:tetratricopeptide (TPR) repeat protein
MTPASAKSRWTALALLAAAALLGPAPATAAWWNLDWPCRRLVTLDGYKPTRLPGDDIAVVTMPTGGAVKPDGSDVRVATASGIERPCRVLMIGPGDMARLAFAVRPGQKDYYVYFGHPDPPPRRQDLDVRRGVLLQMWLYPGGGLTGLDAIKKIVHGRAKPFIGADFVDRIFLGHNPFGPQARVASLFTGYLKCPADGEYVFCTSSRNASFLLVDDKLVVDNGGWHKPQRDISKNAKVSLKAGVHKVTVYHVSGGGAPVIAAAWRPPGERRVWPIPAQAFAPVAAVTLGAMQKQGQAANVDFLYDHAGETFLDERYYQRYTFRALGTDRLGRGAKLTWDFGDGQKASGAKAEHVYLVDGERAVTFTAETGLGTFTRTNRIWVTRPWDRVTQRGLDSLRMHGRIVAAYDFAALAGDALAEAVALLEAVGNHRAVIKAGEAFAARDAVSALAAGRVMPAYARSLGRAGRSRQAVETLEKTAARIKAPNVAASLLVLAGRAALDDLRDARRAMALFTSALKRHGHLTTSPVIRDARIGVGDVHRFLGDYEEAAKAYDSAGIGPDIRGMKIAIARGNFARYVEDLTRRGDYDDARQHLRDWAGALPADKLAGYLTLLQVRLLLAQKRFDDAAAEAQALVRVNPRSNYAAELLKLTSEAYRGLGQKEKAAAALKAIVADYPESPLAAWAQEALKKP